MALTSSKKTAIIFEGGGSKGAFEAGIIKYITENKERIKIDLIGGTSVGGLNAACLAFGKTDRLLQIWQNIKNSDIYSPGGFVELLNGLRTQEKTAATNIKGIFDSIGYLNSHPLPFLRIPTILGIYGKYKKLKNILPPASEGTLKALLKNLLDMQSLLDNQPLYRICEELFGNKKISDAKSPDLFITAFDLQNAQLQVFGPDRNYGDQDGLVLDALTATSAIQGAFPIKVMGNQQYIDGGNGANLPLKYAVDHQCSRIILARDNSPDKPITDQFKYLWDVVLRAYLATFTNTTMRDIKWTRDMSNRIGREERNMEKLLSFSENIDNPELKVKYQSMLNGLEKIFENKYQIEVIEIVPTNPPLNIVDFESNTSRIQIDDGYNQAKAKLDNL